MFVPLRQGVDFQQNLPASSWSLPMAVTVKAKPGFHHQAPLWGNKSMSLIFTRVWIPTVALQGSCHLHGRPCHRQMSCVRIPLPSGGLSLQESPFSSEMVASLCSKSSFSVDNYFEGWNNKSYCRFGREFLGLGFIVNCGEVSCHRLEGATQVCCFDNSFVL